MANNQTTLLIVEDEAMLREALATKCRKEGFTVLTGANGEEGLSQALAHHPDIILLDILMPKMTGITMIGEVRKDSWGVSVPIIILTNMSVNTDSMLKEVKDLQPIYYLIKSEVKLEDVIKKVKEILHLSS